MPRLKAETREARRNHLLDAAARCFVRLGVSRTTMSDILAEAGVSAGAAYAHFRSKEDLIEEMTRRSVTRDVSMIRACGVPGDMAATLSTIVDLFFADWREPGARESTHLDVGVLAEAQGNQRVAEALRDSARQDLLALATALANAAGGRPQRFSAQAHAIAALMVGLIVLWHVDPGLDPFGVEKQVRTIIAALEEEQ